MLRRKHNEWRVDVGRSNQGVGKSLPWHTCSQSITFESLLPQTPRVANKPSDLWCENLCHSRAWSTLTTEATGPARALQFMFSGFLIWGNTIYTPGQSKHLSYLISPWEVPLSKVNGSQSVVPGWVSSVSPKDLWEIQIFWLLPWSMGSETEPYPEP
jgi:hypothetical protein